MTEGNDAGGPTHDGGDATKMMLPPSTPSLDFAPGLRCTPSHPGSGTRGRVQTARDRECGMNVEA